MTTKKKILVLLALALGACRAQNRSSIEIRGRAPPASATECSYTGGGTTYDGRRAILDVGAVYNSYLRYRIPLFVDNLLSDPALGSSAASKISKDWVPKIAVVQVNPGNYASEFHPSPVLANVSIANNNPLQGNVIQVGQQGIVIVDVVSHELGLALQTMATPGQTSQVMLGITLQGLTQDGEELDTGEWTTPLEICVDCLPCVGCLSGASPICPAGTVATSSCGGPGQDTSTTCTAATP